MKQKIKLRLCYGIKGILYNVETNKWNKKICDEEHQYPFKLKYIHGHDAAISIQINSYSRG